MLKNFPSAIVAGFLGLAIFACQSEKRQPVAAPDSIVEPDSIVDVVEIPIPEDALYGDFDGDGQQEYLWASSTFDEEGYATSPISLMSNRVALPKEQVLPGGGMGVMLFNLGRLDDSQRDFVGAIYYSISNWCQYYVYDFANGHWRQSIEPFSVWIGNEDYDRVRRDPSRPGYVIISHNDMTDLDSAADDSMFANHSKSVPLNI